MQRHSIVAQFHTEEDGKPACPRAASHVSPTPLATRMWWFYLLNKRHEEFDNSLERIFLQRIFVWGQETEDVCKTVVYGIIFRWKFGKEHLGQISDPTVFILETFCHFSKLPLDLDLSSQNQERERHEACLFNWWVSVTQSSVQEISVLIDQTIKTNRLRLEITEMETTISPRAITALLRITGFFDLSIMVKNKGNWASQKSAISKVSKYARREMEGTWNTHKFS
jgi:hypothetical protein